MISKSKYRHLFFDLDHTLWDFEKNSMETLQELFQLYQLDGQGIPFSRFVEIYHGHNKIMWQQFEAGKINRIELRIGRFHKTLMEFRIDDYTKAARMAEVYLEILPEKTNLMPGCKQLLEHLVPNYQLHLITNGFTKVQKKKLHNADLLTFFVQLITSEDAKAQKPEKEIFDYAYNLTGARPHESLMIGDNPTADMGGAFHSGMDRIFFNPTGMEKCAVPINLEISDLRELINHL